MDESDIERLARAQFEGAMPIDEAMRSLTHRPSLCCRSRRIVTGALDGDPSFCARRFWGAYPLSPLIDPPRTG